MLKEIIEWVLWFVWFCGAIIAYMFSDKALSIYVVISIVIFLYINRKELLNKEH